MTDQQPVQQPSMSHRILVTVGKVAAYLALFLGCQTLLVTIFTAVITAQLMTTSGITSQEQLLQMVYPRVLASSTLLTLFSGLLTILILFIVYKVRGKTLGEAFWIRKVPARTLLAGPTMVPALYLAVTMFLMLLPSSLLAEYEEASAMLAEDVGIIPFISMVLISPIAEELIFRGLIMTRLTYVLQPMGAVILSAAIFGACHGELVWFCYAFLLGMVFGLMDMKAGSILPSIATHISFNLVGQIFSTCSVLLPPGTYEVVLMVGLVALAIFLPMTNRRAVSAVFMGPVRIPDVAAAPARPKAKVSMPQAAQVPQAQQPAPLQWDSGNTTVTWSNTEFVADPWL